MNHYLKMASIALFASMIASCSSIGNSVQTPTHTVTSSASVANGSGDLSGAHIMQPFNHFIQPNLNGALSYHGGPVLKTPVVYVVFWGFNASGADPTGEKAYMTAFLSGVGGTPWSNTNHQYYQIVGSLTQHIANEPSQLAGTWVDSTNRVPKNPGDKKIQEEAARLAAHVGFHQYASYVVATPHGHNTPGFGTGFCAYHGVTMAGSHAISYTNLPYMTDAGPNCGENAVNAGSAGVNDGVSIVEGHEYAESETDPQLDAWWDSSNGGEIGDLCAWQGLGDITESTGTFAMQPLWSDKAAGCTLHTP